MRKICFLPILLLLCLFASAQAPLANFTASQTSGCAPLVVSFQDLSTGNPTQWEWDFGNGQGKKEQNPSATYFFPGTYTVKLTVSNSRGTNTLTRTAYITVYDKPKAEFTASSTTGCYPFVVQFNDSSEPSTGTTNVNWQWDFGNGQVSTERSPQITYTRPGDFPVTLKVTNDKGCFAIISKPAYIRVPTGVQVSFDQINSNRCQPPFPVMFNSTSTGPGTLTYQWDFGDGSGSNEKTVTHTYETAGSFSVSLKVTSSEGCSDSLQKTDAVSIQPITTAFEAPDSICILAPATFTNTSSPAAQNSTWDFGDGTQATTANVTKTFNTPGTYTVHLYNKYATCSDTVTKTIQVLPRPVSSFTADKTIHCKPPMEVPFKDASAGAVQWFWDFGDGQTSGEQNPVHTYNSFGDFNVVLIVTNASGCSDTIRRDAFIKIRKPEIVFNALPQSGCIPYEAKMSASVTTLDNVTSYSWDFGDGSAPSTAITPSHTYLKQGSYTVSLTITTSTGCTETLSMDKAIVVGRKPTVDFTASPNPVCAFQPVSFEGITNEGDKWLWNFGDGQTSTEQNPVHTYSITGNLTVSLVVTNSGCKETLSKLNFLEVKPPIAMFNVQKNCSSPKQFSFIDASTGPVTWSWDFGDGQTSKEKSPTHTFAEFGTYRVSLTVTNGTCTHSSVVSVIVHDESPSFKADTTEACKTIAINYTALVQKSDYFRSYDWDFGNGSKATGATPKAIYSTAGTFSNQLIITDIYGCKFPIQKTNYIRINGPTANFTASNNNGCKGLTALFRDQSVSDGVNPITKWVWHYGDGLSETATNNGEKQHTYPNANSYTVQLNLTDAAGCQDSLRIVNLVNTSAPKAGFTPSDTLTCQGSTTQFANQTTSTQSFTSVWDFGDGNTSTLANPSHVYSDTGTYSIRLTIKDAFGCADSVFKPAHVTVKKTSASFTASNYVGNCIPFDVSFTNTSTFFTSSLWNFGNGTDTITNPARTYIVPGNYTVSLTVRGRGGCVDSAKRDLVVYNNREIKFSYSPTEGCQSVFLKASVSGSPGLTYAWDFGDGTLVTTTNKDTSHQYTTFGNFLPRLIVSDSGSCLISFVGTDTVRVRGINTGFVWDRRLLCDSGIIRFTDTSKASEAVTNYLWSFGDGGSSSLQNPVHHYQQSGLYTVTLSVTTASQCKDTAVRRELIKVVKSPSIDIKGPASLCKDEAGLYTGVYLQSDTSAVQWSWQLPGGPFTGGLQPPVRQYSTPGDYTISAVAVNSSGCADTAVKNLKVHPLPTITLPPSLTAQVGTPVTIQPAIYSPGVVSYLWSPADGLSCTDCPYPDAKPKFNTTYQVLVTDSNGCRNTAQVQIVVFCENSNVFVPNTFSPNGDGSNDVFYIRGSGLARVKSLRIFNRWGEIVFQRQNVDVNNAASGWDGTYRGKALAPDTYVYQLEVFCDNSQLFRYEGSIALIR